jgi:hypothetical protein
LEEATYKLILNVITSLYKKLQRTTSIDFFSAEPRLLLPSTIQRRPFSIAAMQLVEQSRTGSVPG